MGRAIPVPQRHVIFERAGRGHRADAIAADLGLSPETVRKLVAGGPDCKQSRSRSDKRSMGGRVAHRDVSRLRRPGCSRPGPPANRPG